MEYTSQADFKKGGERINRHHSSVFYRTYPEATAWLYLTHFFPEALPLLAGARTLRACRYFARVTGKQKRWCELRKWLSWQEVLDSKPSRTSQFRSKGEGDWLITHLSVPAQQQCWFCLLTRWRCFCLTGFAHTFLIYHSLWFNSSLRMELIWTGQLVLRLSLENQPRATQ